MRPCIAGHAHRAEELQPEAGCPVLFRQLEEVAALRRACVVHQDVEPAVGLHAGGDGGFRNARVAEVADERHRAPARALRDFRRHFREVVAAARAEENICPLAGQDMRRGCADATARAGDDGDLVLELEIHAGLSYSLRSDRAARYAHPEDENKDDAEDLAR
jgi:hypothetical protein